MTRVVMKFGGTSLGTLERIQEVAVTIQRAKDAGNEVAVVVSAMAGTTDKILNHFRSISPQYDMREYDTAITAGEHISCGLLTVALQKLGLGARSWLGWQIPIHTDSSHGKARITRIITPTLENYLSDGNIAVIAGFQGLAPDQRVTSLGRGGSDTTAVALAAALKAEACDIYSDVDGVYTTDPRVVPLAQKLNQITYEEMLEMASLGAKILHGRSVELAMKHCVRLHVRSSYDIDKKGTMVVSEDQILEQELVSGIAYSRDEAKITLVGVENQPGIAADIFGPLANANINVDMIVQNVSARENRTDLTFTVAKAEVDHALKTLEKFSLAHNLVEIVHDVAVSKVSVVGVGMKSHAGVAQTMFKTLAEKGINIEVISTSEIKVSVLISDEYTELAVRALHSAYGLDTEEKI